MRKDVLFGFMAAMVMLTLFYSKPIERIEEALQAIDQFAERIPSLPRYAESGYSPLGRSPVVDVLLADPLYMPIYAEIVADYIKTCSNEKQLFALSTGLFKAAGMPQENINSIITFDDQVPEPFSNAFPIEQAGYLFGYWQAFLGIQKKIDTILSVFSSEEKDWIRANYNRFFFESQEGDADYDFFTSDNPHHLKFFALASRIDLAKLADCARQVTQITDHFYQHRDQFAQLTLKEDFLCEEQGLRFLVATKSQYEHTKDADFFIDLGGYNSIRNNAGGTKGDRVLALHVDLKGHNTYIGEKFVQGCGFLGVGMLVSCAGHNVFHAAAYSQGCGFFGSGFLVNYGGENHFDLNFGGQGFGLFGSSIVWNTEGHNQYVARQGMAQAASSTQGIAFLIDNEGHNNYIAGTPGTKNSRYDGIGQGGSSGVRYDPWLNNPSLYGGLAYLFLGGDQNKLRTVWLGQGSAYFMGAGIVVAEGSHNVFEADFDAQGQGLHLAAGLLLNKGSHSRFKGGWGSLGVSGDKAVGMLISFGGHNHYEGTDQSLGTSRKPQSLGVFIDLAGENEFAFRKESSARLELPASPKDWSSSLFIEAGQNSRYPANVDEFTRGNNQQWGILGHSLGISSTLVEQRVRDIFHTKPRIAFPFDPVNGWEGNRSYQPLKTDPSQAQQLADEIGTADYDRRRQIYEALDLMRFQNRKQDVDLAYLLEKPAEISEDAFNYAVLWALRNKDKVKLDSIKQALREGRFQSDYVRKMAVSLVGTYWSADVIPLFQQIMLHDSSEEVRYFAALALTKNLPASSVAILKQGSESDSEVVRYAIAKGLQESANPAALSLLEPLFEDKSFYVRRAAGLSAISLKDKRGIPVVLETLDYETLDTYENYGSNVYKQLAEYLGVDFGLDKDAWRNWWKKAEPDFKM